MKSLVSNPPYNMPWTPPAMAGLLPKYQIMPPKNNANYAFISSSFELCEDKAAFLLPNSVLQPKGKEKEMMKRWVKGNILEAAIQLPERMFESTSIPVCILVFNSNKQTRRVVLVDLSERAEQVEREQRGQFGGASHTGRVYKKTVNVISDEVRKKTVDAIRDCVSEEGFSCVVMPEQIAEKDFQLTPKLYLAKPIPEPTHRPFADIAADYNRVIQQKNAVKITFNETAAKRLGYDCLKEQGPNLADSFAAVGQKAEKENFAAFTKSDGIKIEASTKNGVPDLIVSFLYQWKTQLMFLNNEENRILAEFRDALLPELMSGKIEI